MPYAHKLCLYTNLCEVEIPCSWNSCNFAWILTGGTGKILGFWAKVTKLVRGI